MPPEIWVVLGYPGSGKSTAIRALTGAFSKTHMSVDISGGTLEDMFVHIRSIQEVGMMPDDFIDAYKDERYILTSLRVEGQSRYPNGSEYIQAFIEAGWRINHLAILNRADENMDFPGGSQMSISVSNSDTIPPNRLANHLRVLWKWI
jgi:energy-coupling factor transporter ATP-binding protein EcfA2